MSTRIPSVKSPPRRQQEHQDIPHQENQHIQNHQQQQSSNESALRGHPPDENRIQHCWRLFWEDETPEEFRTDPEIVKIVVSKFGHALLFVSDDLLANPEIIKIAVSKNGWALRYASETLKANRDLVEIAVSNYGKTLEHASLELKANVEIVKIAVSDKGEALKFASENLTRDREIVKIAVSNNGEALEYASADLKADREIVATAIANKATALQFALCDLHNDPVLVAMAFRGGYNGLGFQGHALLGRLRRFQMDLDRFHSDHVVFNNEESAQRLAVSWRDAMWQKINPIYRAMKNDFGPVGVVLEYLDIPFHFCLANELEQLAPLIGAVAERRGGQWRDLPEMWSMERVD